MKHFFKNKYSSFHFSLDEKFTIIPVMGTNYVPQGVCSIDRFLIISCYDSSHKTNSVLFVCSKDGSKKIQLDSKIHCGGICYHKNTDSIYVTGKGMGNKSFIHRYCGKKLLNLGNSTLYKAESVFCVDESCELYSTSVKHSSPAYITCYENAIFVGNFIDYRECKNFKGIIKRFDILSDGNLSKKSVMYENPYSNTQGLCIFKYRGEVYYIFSRSFGRSRNSLLNITKLIEKRFVNINSIVLPSMSEQVNKYDDNKLLLVFESSASCYRKNAITVSEYIYILNFEKLLQCNDSFRDFCIGDKLFINNSGIYINGVSLDN